MISLNSAFQSLCIGSESSSSAASCRTPKNTVDTAQDIISKNGFSSCKPSSYVKRLGRVGDALADALPLFSLDLVGLVDDYLCVGAKEDVETLLKKELEKCLLNFSPFTFSEELELLLMKWGPSTTTLDLFSVITRKDQSVHFEFNDEDIERLLLPHFTHLERLKICCKGDATLRLPKFSALSHLELVRPESMLCIFLEDKFEAFAKGFEKLESLILPFFHKMHLPHLPHFQKLQELTLPGINSQEEIGALLSSLEKMPHLQKLSLELISDISDEIVHFVLHSPLQTLCFYDCKHLDAACVERLIPSPTLQLLIFQNCPKVTREACERLHSKHPNLKLIFVNSSEKDFVTVYPKMKSSFTMF